jgi:hypothetical protein
VPVFRFTCKGTVHEVLSGRLREFPQAVASPGTPSWNQIYAWLGRCSLFVNLSVMHPNRLGPRTRLSQA